MRLTEVGVGKYPKRWGLSFQRPGKRAVEQDPEAVARRHEETWPKIRVKARKDGSEILFAGQVGFRSDQVTGRTWGEMGRTPVVRRSGNRFSVDAMSAISSRGRMHFMVFTESFTAGVMCRFLDRLAGHFDHEVHLVLDGHSAHRSRKVRDWLAAHPDDVELHFLPPVLARAQPRRAGQRRPRTQPAQTAPSPRSGRTRRGDTPLLLQTPASATHRPRLLRRPTRPLHPGREPHGLLINSCHQRVALSGAFEPPPRGGEIGSPCRRTRWQGAAHDAPASDSCRLRRSHDRGLPGVLACHR
ncbi:IS630 family transposase [Streptomyces sp. NPDC056194]|uniref:IS630 family transposase n=1 Tax=unclassified Streptomyces TaxID=2593676 RepID=UPI0035DD7B63